MTLAVAYNISKMQLSSASLTSRSSAAHSPSMDMMGSFRRTRDTFYSLRRHVGQLIEPRRCQNFGASMYPRIRTSPQLYYCGAIAGTGAVETQGEAVEGTEEW